MNKRQRQKQKTREMILQTAKSCFMKNGFLKTTTSEIAQKSKVAHGTLFLHFRNKDALIIEILDLELDRISKQIFQIINESNDFELLLSKYLDLLQEQEDLFATLARELPFYSDELRRKILFRESIIRSHFRKAIADGVKINKFKRIEIIPALTFLFGTINYYLSLKPIFVKEGSVIEKFKESIISTFMDFVAPSSRWES
ncbi:MAG TPA: TetR/AcrR family transcriptional regulator [Candidatus Cloacimonetes bacterium]|nr:TetR/AcrR family transcriptional regulator [Candidatus Cloacimonadota bacterium]